jgi:hypothetical protein
LIGWAPGPRGSDGECSRGAWDGSTGTRLARLLELDRADLPSRFELVNLLDLEPMADATPPEPFPARAGGACAARLAPFLAGRAVILGGVRVAAAFGLPGPPWGLWRGTDLLGYQTAGYATVPHLCGLTRQWSPKTVEGRRLRDFVADVASSADPAADARLVLGMTGMTGERPDTMVGYARAAEILGISVDHLRHLVHRRQIPHYRPTPRTVLFQVGELRLRILAGRVRQTSEGKGKRWNRESERGSASGSSSSASTR